MDSKQLTESALKVLAAVDSLSQKNEERSAILRLTNLLLSERRLGDA